MSIVLFSGSGSSRGSVLLVYCYLPVYFGIDRVDYSANGTLSDITDANRASRKRWPGAPDTSVTFKAFPIRAFALFYTTYTGRLSSLTTFTDLSLDSEAVLYTVFLPVPYTLMVILESSRTVTVTAYSKLDSSGATDPTFKPAPLALVEFLGISDSTFITGPGESATSSLALE